MDRRRSYHPQPRGVARSFRNRCANPDNSTIQRSYANFPVYTSWTADFYLTQFRMHTQWQFLADHYLCCGYQGFEINSVSPTNNIHVNIGGGIHRTELYF